MENPKAEEMMAQMEARIFERVGLQMVQLFQHMQTEFDKKITQAIIDRTYLPELPMPHADGSAPFMSHSTCSVADFIHPRYAEICGWFHQRVSFHRKAWEWVFIIHKLTEAGVLGEGKRGVVFGVGKERLPALFASRGANIVATDAPPEIQSVAGWSATNQHSASVDQLRCPEIIGDETFGQRVSHRFCDMRAIDPELTDFDFTWSSCCFEHLGSLEAGMQFVIDSVEKTLKIGGVACHTTEFNLSSNDETVTDGPTVLYRARDMLELIDRLRQRGHEVEPFSIAPDSHPLDFHVDLPPWRNKLHLKLRLQQYVATSVGIVVRRGR